MSATFDLHLTLDARNNTTQPNLTYYERSLLRQGSAAKRIGGDSFKPLDSCNLCLSKATAPVACPSGHIYCRECAISNLLTQKAGIEGQRREMERWDEMERRDRDDAKRAARERVVRDFERGMALGGGGGRRVVEEKEGRGKGKFEFDGESVEKVAREAEEKAMRTIEAEQVEARKSKLAAFWLPSLTPEAKLGPLKDVKLQTLCNVGGTPHPFSWVQSPYHCSRAQPQIPAARDPLLPQPYIEANLPVMLKRIVKFQPLNPPLLPFSTQEEAEEGQGGSAGVRPRGMQDLRGQGGQAGREMSGLRSGDRIRGYDPDGEGR